MEAIILAGGFGTRLRSVVSDVPKPMAPIRSRPFLSYILNYIKKLGIQRVILSTGYKHEVIEKYFGNHYEGIEIVYSRESEALGTGGAIKLALQKVRSNEAFVFNGDTFFQADIAAMKEVQVNNDADIVVSLKLMCNFDRYGTVEINNGRITSFLEKKQINVGLINAGVYLIKSDLFSKVNLSEKFSFEADFLQIFINELQFFGVVSEGYFIDIGIPEDYAKAQTEIADYVK